jgi:hypothetical protein
MKLISNNIKLHFLDFELETNWPAKNITVASMLQYAFVIVLTCSQHGRIDTRNILNDFNFKFVLVV